MQILNESSWPEIIHIWLRSERPSESASVDSLPDGTDKHAARRTLLAHRDVILSQLPDNPHASNVHIEEADLPDVFVIPALDWYSDTGGTFRLIDTAQHLKPGRGSLIMEQPGPIGHYHSVVDKSKYIGNYDAATTEEVLILIAPSETGPFTIIDGNNRAAALYMEHLNKPNMPWKGILIWDPKIAESRWFVRSPSAQMSIWHLGIYASRGLLW